jgi:4-hydroxybenzoate polyprenyltransferase
MVAAFFRATRPLNLLILALAQGASITLLLLLQAVPRLPTVPSLGLLLSTLLVCAGGNLINDILDREADARNKPGRNPVGRELPLSVARWLYAGLTLGGGGLGLVLGLSLQLGWVSGLPAAAALLLALYSRYWQHWPFAGNLTVALLVALSVLLPMCFFVPDGHWTAAPAGLTLVYFALLAALSTWTREWVKDLEDQPGDALAGARTAALVLPLATSKNCLYGLVLLQALLVVATPFAGWLTRSWALLILAGYVVLLRQIHRAEAPESFRQPSLTAKILMALGIAWMAVLAGQLAWFTLPA